MDVLQPPAHNSSEHQRWDREQQSQGDLPAGLPLWAWNLDVDWVPRLTCETRIRVRGQGHVGIQVRRVADVRREEVVQALWSATRHERSEPGCDRSEKDRDRPQSEPDEVRDRR